MRLRGLLIAGVVVVPPRAAAGGFHPIHTTFTEIVQAGTGGKVSITIRGFEDDLAVAARAGTPRGTGDSAIAHYLERQVALTDARGRRVVLELRNIRRSEEVLWFTYETLTPLPLDGSRFANAALTELYRDQVNLVQVRIGRRVRTILFTPGDGAKPIG